MNPLPPPQGHEDPWFAVRVAFGVCLAFIATEPLNVPVPVIPPVVIASLMATSRGALNLPRVIGAGVAIPVICWLSSFMVSVTGGQMLVFTTAMLILTFFGMLLVMKTGNRMGILLLVFPHLIGLMGVKSMPGMEALRDSFVTMGFLSIAVIPVCYLLFPPRTRQTWEETPEPSAFDRPWVEAGLRTAALAPIMIAFYLWVDSGDLIYMVTALLVLIYPHRHQQRLEAISRFASTATGGALAFVAVVITMVQPNPAILVIAVFLGVLWFARRMMRDPDRVYMHQLAMMIFVIIALGGFTGVNPFTTMIDRLALTLGGAAFALAAIYLMRWLFARSTIDQAYRTPPSRQLDPLPNS